MVKIGAWTTAGMRWFTFCFLEGRSLHVVGRWVDEVPLLVENQVHDLVTEPCPSQPDTYLGQFGREVCSHLAQRIGKVGILELPEPGLVEVLLHGVGQS